MLELSSNKGLKSIAFVETSFCDISEKGTKRQVLVLPEKVGNVAFIGMYGSKWSNILIKGLEQRGLGVYMKDVKLEPDSYSDGVSLKKKEVDFPLESKMMQFNPTYNISLYMM